MTLQVRPNQLSEEIEPFNCFDIYREVTDEEQFMAINMAKVGYKMNAKDVVESNKISEGININNASKMNLNKIQ